MAATEERRITVVKSAALEENRGDPGPKKPHPRRQGAVAEWNDDIPRISLIQIFVIEISMG